ncbi:hypothetical protein GBA52_026836 [Prunus armeniaca]|nr:hypothetical protein GBA52_026836 [Prunus armeniaca]
MLFTHRRFGRISREILSESATTPRLICKTKPLSKLQETKNNLRQWRQPNSALPTKTLINAAEILSDFDYTSMALTLDLASQTLLLS